MMLNCKLISSEESNIYGDFTINKNLAATFPDIPCTSRCYNHPDHWWRQACFVCVLLFSVITL